MTFLDDTSISDTALGIFFCIGAAISFGSFGIPIKIKSVRDANVDPIVFQIYYSISVFFSTWLLLFIEPFQFTPYGVAGAALWVPSSIFSILGIKLLGMAIAQGIWCTTSILVSFIWGYFYFNEIVKDWYLTSLGIFLLLLGVGFISLCNQQWKLELPRKLSWLYTIIPCISPYEEVLYIIDDESYGNSNELSSINGSIQEDSEFMEKPQADKNVFIIGAGACILLGLLNGSRMVPVELTPEELSGLPFVFSFNIGVALVTAIIAPIYFVFQKIRGNGFPKFHLKVALIPGIIAGLIWNVGNICGIYGTLYLGLTIGFPLTQTAVLVGGFWGMTLFKEITRIPAIICFFTGAIILLTGAVLLSVYG